MRAAQRLRPLAAALRALMLLTLALGFSGAARAAADPVKGEVRVSTDGGYARLKFHLETEVEATVHVAAGILVISFKKPVDVAVDRINGTAPDYISAARRDPDRTAIRLALTRKLKINTIPAGEWLFVDLLPDNWKGVMPGLPQDVIDELARRARDAERLLRRQRTETRQEKPAVIRVKVATQPTFIRYVFEMPGATNVTPVRSEGKLTLKFDQPIKWDMAEALAALPKTLESIDNDSDYDSTMVTFTLNGAPDVRDFREDQSIVVDIGLTGAKAKPAAQSPAAQVQKAVPAIEPPDTVPPSEDAKADSKGDAKGEAKREAKAEVKAEAEKTPALAAAAPEKTAPSAAPAAATVKAAAPASPSVAPRPAPNPNAPVVVEVHRSGDTMRLEFPFAEPTAAAVFRRADMLWLVFDSVAKIDLAALADAEVAQTIRASTLDRGADGEAIVRLRLTRPQLASLSNDGPSWIVGIGDSVAVPTRPLGIARVVAGKNRASIAIPFEQAQSLHRLTDPDVGDKLMVITALGPARGFLKAQDFVELRALPSTHGVVVQPLADDITAELSVDKITLTRPGGLTLSAGAIGERAPSSFAFNPLLFDTQLWGFDREAKFSARQAELIRQAAMAPEAKRYPARLNLARFYLARDMAAEAKAVLTVALADQRVEDVTGTVLKAISEVMLERPDEALKDLASPQVGNQLDAPLWRAVALARQGKWGEARERFKGVEGSIGTLPIELQRMALRDELRAAIEVRDFTGATRMFDEFDSVGVPPRMEASMAVLTGKLDEGLGRTEDALAAYRTAAESSDRRAAAQGHLRELVLRFASGDMPRKEMIAELETLTTVWRGDETETEGLKLLAHLYTEDGRYREAFHVMRAAMLAHPNSDMTRQIQDEAAVTFDSLFLAGKGDAMPPIEALGLFYDYRELTPIGRRGDEMIRKLADRLVAVDLLDQAAELLQHQVDHRLQGAARVQVATRLAVIYLMNRKPDRALATLRATRSADLSNELRDERLLLEARALSDIGRHELALEVIANIEGRQALRLRADILWAARRWKDAAQQIELLYGDRWKDFTPLTEAERSDILRAAIGYALGDEAIGLASFREKYAPKMADTADGRAFDVVSAPIGNTASDFQSVAKTIAGIDTLDAFLRDMRARYPDSSALSAAAAGVKDAAAKPPAPKPDKPQAATPNAAPEQAAVNAPVKPGKPAAASSPLPPKVPAGVPLKPDPAPTGSIPRR
jgi:hypothetical protein